MKKLRKIGKARLWCEHQVSVTNIVLLQVNNNNRLDPHKMVNPACLHVVYRPRVSVWEAWPAA